MRRIKNTPALKEQVRKFNETLFSQRDVDNFKMPLTRLGDFITELETDHADYTLTQVAMVAYLSYIEDQYQKILNADETVMMSLIDEFNLLIPCEQVQEDSLFWKRVVSCMCYDQLREKEMLPFLHELGIKTCIYCHSQLTLTIKKTYYKNQYLSKGIKKGDVKEWRGILSLDHRYPKSKYPFLSSSFYNLYPTCANCNQSKNDKSCDFILYCDNDDLDAFTFKLNPESVINYWDDRKLESIEIELIPSEPQPAEGFSHAYEEMFDVLKIYNTQKDVIEELIHKAEVYTKEYNAELIHSFTRLFPDQGFLNRMIIGNYDQPEDIHKRPMAKFVQEIARDLKLIT